jgi:hypothetical protein
VSPWTAQRLICEMRLYDQKRSWKFNEEKEQVLAKKALEECVWPTTSMYSCVLTRELSSQNEDRRTCLCKDVSSGAGSSILSRNCFLYKIFPAIEHALKAEIIQNSIGVSG